MTRLQASLGEENKFKYNKEQDGTKFVKEARDDLQKICRILLQKKLENEDLRAEVFELTLTLITYLAIVFFIPIATYRYKEVPIYLVYDCVEKTGVVRGYRTLWYCCK